MQLKHLSVTLTLIISCVRTEKKLPEYITVCKRNDPKIEECWMKNYNTILPLIANTGIPEMNVGPIEPFVLEKISLDIGNSAAVSFHAALRNIKLWGLKDSKALTADFDLKKEVLKVALVVPSASMQSEYAAEGKVLVFQFNSSGHFNLNLTNANINITYRYKTVDRSGKQYIRGNVSYIDIEMEKAQVYLENLFPNKDLNAAANEAFNANIDVIFDEIKPLISESVAGVVTNIFNTVHDGSFPIDVLFPLE